MDRNLIDYEARLSEIQVNLFQIHSLGHLLKGEYQRLVDNEQFKDLEEESSPILSIALIIMEKSIFCLKRADI